MDKKGGLPADALWNGAALIVGGTIHDPSGPQGPYWLATLRVGVLYRGVMPAETTTVRIYGPHAKEGTSAIWFFRGRPDGIFTEEYPWIRAGPEQFLIWPQTERERVLERLPHEYSEKVRGMRLGVIRAPAARDDPLSVWLVLLTAPNEAPEDTSRIPTGATLRVTHPDGQVTESRVDVPRSAAGVSSEFAVRVLRRADADPPEQIVIAAPAQRGVHRVTLVAPMDAAGSASLTANLTLEY